MFRRHAQLRATLLLLGDLLATALALLATYWIRFGSGLFSVDPVGRPWDPAWYFWALLPSLALCGLAYAATGSYRAPRGGGDRSGGLGAALVSVLSATLLLAAGALFYRDEYPFSRGLLLLFPAVAVLPVWCARRFARSALAALHGRGIGVSRAIVVGEGRTASALTHRLAEATWTGIRVTRSAADVRELEAALAETRPAQVFLALPAGRAEELSRALRILADEMVDVRVVPDLGSEAPLNPDVCLFSGLPVVTFQETPFHGTRRYLKRAFDLAVGAVLLIALLPLMLLVGLLVLVTSGRPVFYHQERMGLDGRRFRIHKFRTMKVGAEAESGAVWATRGDPRCTKVGRILRRLSLDELPQLGNVLMGEMSLVGPRPERPVFTEEFRRRLPRYMLRHRIPAGLTGWAQVNGCRGDSGVEERLRYDLAYLERWSILFDVEILLRTVWQVLRGQNAV